MRVKTAIYRWYFWYFNNFPIQTGKSFLGRCLYRVLGNAVFTIHGQKFELSPVGFIDKYILNTGEYDGIVLRQIMDSIKNGGLFIDIGANFGYYTIMAAAIKNVRVMAFEPSPREASRLKKNVLLNNLTNVSLYQMALSDKAETRQLYLYRQHNAGMNTLISLGNSFESVSVECRRLDELVDARELQDCFIIKIDVEGFEAEVLRGMGNLLNDFRGKIIVEINYETEKDIERADWIYNYMSERHYESVYRKGVAIHYNELFYKET